MPNNTMDRDIKNFVNMSSEELQEEFSNTFNLANQKMYGLDILNESPHPTLSFAHKFDSGFDLRAWIKEDEGELSENGVRRIRLEPLERYLVSTGLFVKLPLGTELQVRPRSGCALKQGLSVLNTPGTVDEPYRGEIKIIAVNLSNTTTFIEDGDRIAQGVVANVIGDRYLNINNVKEISKDTERGTDGFNSTGLK